MAPANVSIYSPLVDRIAMPFAHAVSAASPTTVSPHTARNSSKRVTRDELAGALDQNREHGRCPGCELCLARASPEATALRIEAVATEANLLFHQPFRRPHAGGSSLEQSHLLRINEASGPPGQHHAGTRHPGSEAAYVLAGEETFRTPHGVKRIGAGKAEPGHAPDTPMQASSSGSVDLYSLVMFVVDAMRPFSSPATPP